MDGILDETADKDAFNIGLLQQKLWADCNGDGQYNQADVDCFAAHFAAGCF